MPSRTLALLCTLALAGCSFRTAPSTITVVADYETSLALSGDGTLAVTQRFVLDVPPGGAAAFVETVDGAHVDRFDRIAAAIDEQPYAAAASLARTDRHGTLYLSWPVAALSPGRHTLDLRFRANGTIAMDGGRAAFVWPLLPVDRGYRVEHASVRLTLPGEARITTLPSVDDSAFVRAAEAGVFAASAADVPATAHPVVATRFSAEGLPFPDPNWAVTADRATQLVPAFWTAAGFLLVVGGGALVMLMLRYFRRRPAVGAPPVAPDEVPAAVAAALAARGARLPARLLAATVLDLARRGRIRFVEDGSGAEAPRWRLAVLDERETGAALWTHERVVLGALTTGAAVTSRSWPTVARRLRPAFARALREDLTRRGLLDEGRVGAARGLLVTALVATGLGLAGLALAEPEWLALGHAQVLIPWALLGDAALFAAGGVVLSKLSDEGAAEARRWRVRAAEVRRTARHDATGWAWLPFAVGVGVKTKQSGDLVDG